MASKRKLDLGNVVGSKGDRGTTYVPNVSPTGDLSWSNDDGLENPATVNIKGERGERGEQGATGNAGEKGDKGDTGAVYTPTVSDAGDLSWTNNGGLPNPKTVNIKGEKGDTGATGATGAAGKNGTSAYDAAKAGGYSGAEVEFNAILSIIDKHASRHAIGGADPLTPSSIGAIPSTGGMMTGHLLSDLGGTSSVACGGFVGNDSATYIEAYKDANSVYGVRRQLFLHNPITDSTDDSSLVLTSFDGTTWRGYSVLNSSNFPIFVKPENIGAATNPNLLDNWYFADPINQRGMTEYTGIYSYSIDRWKIDANNTTVSIVDDGILLTGGETYSQLVQLIPDKKLLSGRTLTFSAVVRGSVCSKRILVYDTIDIGYYDFVASGDWELVTVTFTLPVTFSNDNLLSIRIYPSFTADNIEGTLLIKAVKLELGNQQTLARQDSSGNWVLLDPPPNKQQELAKCQRYFLPIKYGRFIGNANQYNCYSLVPTPVTMRSKPVATVSSNGTLCTTDSTLTISSTSVSQLMPNGILIVQLLSNSPLTKNVPAILYDPIISFSADL